MQEIDILKKEDFADEESQLIFEARYNFYKTGDWRYLVHLLGSNQKILDRYNNKVLQTVQKINDGLEKRSEWIIFGCGRNGVRLYDLYMKNKVNVLGFCDNAKHGGHYSGKPIFTVNEAVAFSEAGIVIPYSPYMAEMEEQLLNKGVDEKRILYVDVDCIFSVKKIANLTEILLCENSKFVIYGTDHFEMLLCNLFTEAKMNLLAICSESEEYGGSIHGVPVINYKQYCECYQNCYLISVGINYQKLANMGVDDSKLIGMVNIESLQYFDDEIISPAYSTEQVFVDGGCWDLNSTRSFFKWAGKNAKKSYAFEPLNDNYKVCIKNSKQWKLQEKVEIIHGSLWDSEEVLPIFSGGGKKQFICCFKYNGCKK